MSTHTINGVAYADKRDFLIVGGLQSGDTGYAAATGISLATADFCPDQHMVGLILDAGAGNIAFEMVNGSPMTIPFTVPTGYSEVVLKGLCMQKLLKAASGTTFNGHIWPLF